MRTERFWDQVWDEFVPARLDPDEFEASVGQRYRYYLRLFGDVAGKEVLDLGCGNGELSVYLARRGARVTAVDTSSQGVTNTTALAEANDVAASVDARLLDALRVRELDRAFDLVAGTFVLHHVEPFAELADALHDVLRPGGRGLFYENSSANPVLRLLRSRVVGRFGIPKFGDEEEVPLETAEIAVLRRRFGHVRLHVPGFYFFRLGALYLFRDDPRAVRATEVLDGLVHRRLPRLRRFSYHQIVELTRT